MNIWPRRASTHISEITPFCLHLSLAPSTKFPAESCVAVCLKVLSMQLLSHRGTDWSYPWNPKKHQYLFFLRKDLLQNNCQQKTFSSLERYSFISQCRLFLFPPYWCLFNEEMGELKISFSDLWLLVFCFPNQSSMMDRDSHCSYCGPRKFTLLWKQKNVEAYLKSFINMHGYF